MNAIERLRTNLGYLHRSTEVEECLEDVAAVDALYQAAKELDGNGTSQFDTRTPTLLALRAAVRRVEGG